MNMERLNILVVDDEKGVAATVEMVLRHLGHSVDVLHDGSDAYDRLKLFPHLYDVLITDHCMRNVSGLELVAQLRGTRFQGGIVVLSASLSQEMEEAYYSLGAGMVMQKPFEMAELRHAVEVLRPMEAA
jgi:DNA-binding response OmpR family regulator